MTNDHRVVGRDHNNPPSLVEGELVEDELSPVSQSDIPVDKAAMTIAEFCHWAAIGRTSFYKLVASGELPVRKIGKRTVVLIKDASHWLNNLPVGR